MSRLTVDHHRRRLPARVAIVLTSYLKAAADQGALAGLVAKGALKGGHFRTDDPGTPLLRI